MNKYAIYTSGETFPVLEKDGNYYIARQGTGHFSGQWKLLGVVERLKGNKNIIKPEDALKITDWKFKNGTPRYQVIDFDHGSIRRWVHGKDLSSFGTISDNMFDVITGIKSDDEIVLEESKKYNIYATYGEDGVYNSELVDTVDSEEQAVDKVAELQATGVGASYEEVEDNKREAQRLKESDQNEYSVELKACGNIDHNEDPYNNIVRGEKVPKNIKKASSIEECQELVKNYIDEYNLGGGNFINAKVYKNNTYIGYISYNGRFWNEKVENDKKEEECSQASGVASGVDGKIDSFPINPKEMEKQRLKEDINNPYFVIEDIGAAYLMAGPFKTKAEAERKKKEQIKEYNLEEEAEIIHVWDWNTIKEFEDNAYDTYQEFINAGDSAPYYKEEKLEESKEDDIFNAREELIDYLNENTKYEWDANESYDNCAITESETDYIEVFVDIKDGNKIYTVDNYSYNSLEELVKNMPVLFTDEDEDYDYDEGWEDLDESKDLTKTLQEMALLEDYEDENEISPQRQKFIDYCKDKIEDLGDIEIYDEDYEENIQYHKLMHTEGIREFNDLYIIANFDDYENENLIAINNENKIVIDTPMIDCNGYAATMQFDKIDKQFYDQLMDYWDDLYMDEMIEEE